MKRLSPSSVQRIRQSDTTRKGFGGGILEQVADYLNYDNSIGYSFRFFTTGMNSNSGIKLLAVDDYMPNDETIMNGDYPFTANLYAISLKGNRKRCHLS